MSSNALSAQGMVIAIGDTGSPQVLSTVPEVVSINGPSGSANLLDATDLSSTGKEYKVGLKDEGEISLEVNYIPDNAIHSELRAAFSAASTKAARLTFTDSAPTTKWDFNCIVSGFSVTAAVDALLKATITLKITGAITQGT